MHAVTTKAVAGTVTGFPIRCVPRAKTDEAEGAFALVVHGSPPILPSLHWSHSRHRISSHLKLHLMLSITQHFAINQVFSSQVKSNMHLYFYTFIHSTHTPFYHYDSYPALDLFFVSFPMSPTPDTRYTHHLRPGFTTFMTTQHYSFLIPRSGWNSLDWIERVRAQHFSPVFPRILPTRSPFYVRIAS